MTPGARHAVLVLVALWIGLGSYSLWQASRQADALHNSQVEACEQSLAPGGLRALNAGDYRGEIKTHKGNIRRTRRIDYAKYSLTVPKKVRRNSIERDARAIDHLHEKVKNVLGVDCHAQYPKP